MGAGRQPCRAQPAEHEKVRLVRLRLSTCRTSDEVRPARRRWVPSQPWVWIPDEGPDSDPSRAEAQLRGGPNSRSADGIARRHIHENAASKNPELN